MLKIFSTATFLVGVAGAASGDHFNQRNLIELCAENATFNSECYTYIAAYKDLVGYMRFLAEDEMIQLMACLTNLNTADVVRRIPYTTVTSRSGQVGDMLLKRFCD